MTSTMPLAETTVRHPGPPYRTRVAVVLVALYLAAAIPMILLLGPRGRPGEDQINYHEPVVRTFAEQLPSPELSDYLSATTPGYHLVLAAIERALSPGTSALQLAGACFTVLLLVLLARTVCSHAIQTEGSWRESLVLCLPFACSMYVLHAGVWMLPDNAGWLFVLACLALALRAPFDRRTIVLGGMALVGLVLVRQVHLWAAGVLWAAAWLAPGIDPPGGVRQLLTRVPDRMRSLTPMLIASLPAFLVLGAFMRLWGGLVPPTFQNQYSIINFSSYAFVLSLLGIGSVFFVGYLVDPFADLMKKSKRRTIVLAAIAGAVAAILPSTTFSVSDGRSSGLWNLVKVVPTIAGHTSPVIVVLSAFGAAMLALWCRALPPRERWIFLGALFGFATGQAFVGQIWQRYNEPMVLLTLALMAACSRPTGASPVYVHRLLTPVRIGGVAALAIVLAALSAYTISRFGPAAAYDINKLNPQKHQSTPLTP